MWDLKVGVKFVVVTIRERLDMVDGKICKEVTIKILLQKWIQS